MQPGDETYRTPYDEGAVDRAKGFCQSRALTPKDVKIVRRDGYVRIIVIRDGVKCKV